MNCATLLLSNSGSTPIGQLSAWHKPASSSRRSPDKPRIGSSRASVSTVSAISELENLIVLQHPGLEIAQALLDFFHGQFDLPRLQVGDVNVALALQFLQFG